jgi:hypothetical protein
VIDDPCRTCHHDAGCPFDDRAERRKDGDTDPSGSMADYAQSRWERNR